MSAVAGAVAADYQECLRAFILRRGGVLARILGGEPVSI